MYAPMPLRKKLQPSLFTIEGPDSASFGVVASTTSLKVYGTWRKYGDFVSMVWDVNQIHSSLYRPHPRMKYMKSADFRNLRLTYTLGNFTNVEYINTATPSTLTIQVYDTDGVLQSYNVTLLPYATYVPTTGFWVVVLDFGNLKTDGGVLIDTSRVVRLKWNVMVDGYILGSGSPLLSPLSFYQEFVDWGVEGSIWLDRNRFATPDLDVGLVVDYDVMYNNTPLQIVEDIVHLGFKEEIMVYMGTRWYNRRIDGSAPSLYSFEEMGDNCLHYAAQKWLADLCAQAAIYKLTVNVALGLEVSDPPVDYTQADHTTALAMPTASTYVLDPTHANVAIWFAAAFDDIGDILVANGYESKVHLTFAKWWWWRNGDKPCFYRTGTTDLYFSEVGTTAPVYTSTADMQIALGGYENFVTWLRDKLGTLETTIQTPLVNKFENTLGLELRLGALEYAPWVVDAARDVSDTEANAMYRLCNRPTTQWQGLDFFATSAYLWVQLGRWAKLEENMEYAKNVLGFNSTKSYYVCGSIDPTQAYEVLLDSDLLEVYTSQDEPFLVLDRVQLHLQRARNLQEIQMAVDSGLFSRIWYWSAIQYHQYAIKMSRINGLYGERSVWTVDE